MYYTIAIPFGLIPHEVDRLDHTEQSCIDVCLSTLVRPSLSRCHGHVLLPGVNHWLWWTTGAWNIVIVCFQNISSSSFFVFSTWCEPGTEWWATGAWNKHFLSFPFKTNLLPPLLLLYVLLLLLFVSNNHSFGHDQMRLVLMEYNGLLLVNQCGGHQSLKWSFQSGLFCAL